MSWRGSLWMALIVICTLRGVQAAAGDPGEQDGAAQKCQVAVVSPVTGFAECVQPRGAHVDPPPPRPAPTPEECLKHADLDVESCRQTPPKAEH